MMRGRMQGVVFMKRFVDMGGKSVDLDYVDCEVEFSDNALVQSCIVAKERYLAETEEQERFY